MQPTKPDIDNLYKLLPELYREKDSKAGFPLRALLEMITGQVEILETGIQQLWDNFFIDTCDRWAIPYIGDLVGNNLLHDSGRIDSPDTARELFEDLNGPDLRPPIAIRTRTDVAKTIYYRRRKGTLPMLEELARDVTGWGAHAVTFFELLNTTQHLNHMRLLNHDCPDIRCIEPLERINGPFDSISHTADVRPIGQDEGWYNIQNIGVFLWRLNSYPLENVPAQQAGKSWQYHFSPLGNPIPLFTRRRREGDEAGLATELHLPGPIRKAFFYEDLNKLCPDRLDNTDLYALFNPLEGSDLKTHCQGSFFIFLNGIPVPPAVTGIDPSTGEPVAVRQIICRRLNPWPSKRPNGKVIAVDVEHGRMAIGKEWGIVQCIDVYFHYGFSAGLGGGSYDRSKWLLNRNIAVDEEDRIKVYEVRDGSAPPQHSDLISAVDAWKSDGRKNAVISILDSRNYSLPDAIELSDQHWLVIEAANNQRPLLQTETSGMKINVSITGGKSVENASSLTISGVVVEGYLEVTDDLGRLRLLHSTLVPGRQLKEEDGSPKKKEPSLMVSGGSPGKTINTQLRVEIAFSISGPLRLPDHAEGLWLLDSIVDGIGETAISKTYTSDEPGPPATIERSTIFGPSYFRKLPLASETIFTKAFEVTQLQQGCVRFSFVPEGSETPRKYRCQPDLEIAKQVEQAEQKLNRTLTDTERVNIRASVQNWLKPAFTKELYGAPAYAQLSLGCPTQIRTGAEDGSEMGAFCHLKQAQRETNLRIRMEEYLPFGLEAGVIYVT